MATLMRVVSLAVVLAVLLGASGVRAEAGQDRFGAGGYFRVMTRPDFQGGDSRLGYWNLYGRLLNEGPWAALELRLDMLPPEAGTMRPWTSIHAKIEGGSVGNAHAALGRLDNFYLTQLYAEAGNVLLDAVTWRIGTLDTYFGDLGLYDMRPAQLFFETMGVSALYRLNRFELMVGAGDSGYFVRRDEYNTIFTVGSYFRVRPLDQVEVGLGGQLLYEPEVIGNRFAPHATPGIRYEDLARQEVVERFLEENPGREDNFTNPVSSSSASWKVVGYLGFGQVGPLRWNNLFLNVQLAHPDNFYVESFMGRDYAIYTHDLTDERYSVTIGDEAQLVLVPGLLDAAVAGLFGQRWDRDNEVSPGDFSQTYYSAVVRLQLYLTETLHLLAETSLAREVSSNGNRYRAHADSVFQNDGGVSDTRGLEFGDLETRNTWQGKLGFVLNPTGTGIFSRPSLRLLYGVQRSNQNNAFGNSFVTTLDEFNDFGSPEQHWHHLVALEAEAWF